MKKYIFLLLFYFGFTFASINPAEAQCAMCVASVENNVSKGEVGLATGLNTGIPYLLATPYLLAAIVGFLWYKKSKANANKKQPRKHNKY